MTKKQRFTWIRYSLICTVLSILFVSVGCKSTKIETYVAPKVDTKTEAEFMASVKQLSKEQRPATASLTWEVPAEWKIQPASSFRLGSYLAKDNVDISLIKFPGNAGGLLSNVNRWRSQIKLGPLSPTDLYSQAKKTTTQAFSFTRFDLENPMNKQMIWAAILKHENETWFFKASGSKIAVRAQYKNLNAWLESVSK